MESPGISNQESTTIVYSNGLSLQSVGHVSQLRVPVPSVASLSAEIDGERMARILLALLALISAEVRNQPGPLFTILMTCNGLQQHGMSWTCHESIHFHCFHILSLRFSSKRCWGRMVGRLDRCSTNLWGILKSSTTDALLHPPPVSTLPDTPPIRSSCTRSFTRPTAFNCRPPQPSDAAPAAHPERKSHILSLTLFLSARQPSSSPNPPPRSSNQHTA